MDDYFASFWSLYPRKVARVAAQKAANRINPQEWPEIMAGLRRQLPAFRERILNDEKQFIPHPSTWLNQRRWEDEVEDIGQPSNETLFLQFLKSLASSNGSMPIDMPHTIKQAVFRMKIPWGKLKQIPEENLRSIFMVAIENRPVPDQKMAAAGDVL